MSEITKFKQSKSITEAWLPFDTYEKDIITMVLHQLSLRPEKKDEEYTKEDHFFEINGADLVDKVGKQLKPKDFQDACESLQKRTIRIKRRKTGNPLSSQMVSSSEYKLGSGIIELEISQKLLPELSYIANNYTLVDLEILMKLRGKYAKRLYELLCRYRDTGYMTNSLYDLRGFFGTLDPDTGDILIYKDWKDFKKRVLEAATIEIKRETDLDVTFKATRRGRSIVGAEFFFPIQDYQKNIPFTPQTREEAGRSEKLKRVGLEPWQINFIMKYRPDFIEAGLDIVKKKDTIKYYNTPEAMAAYAATVFKCNNKKMMDNWLVKNGMK